MTEEEFIKLGSEYLACERVCGDPVSPEECQRASDRACEIDELLTAAPWEWDVEADKAVRKATV